MKCKLEIYMPIKVEQTKKRYNKLISRLHSNKPRAFMSLKTELGLSISRSLISGASTLFHPGYYF